MANMGKLKHTFNAFQHLQTKFFLKQRVIWYHHNFHILQVCPTKPSLRDQRYSDACKISTNFHVRCKGSESR